MSRRPNILFVFTDQQTRSAVSAYGNRYLHTPHMDSLAAQGVRFWNSYCTSPVCSPSRASLVTGRMPHETGVEINDQSIRPDVPTVGEVFRAGGYETAWAGKWHLIDSYPDGENAIRGFQNLVVTRVPKFWLGTCADEVVSDRAIQFIQQEHRQPFLLSVSLCNPHDICHWITQRDMETLARYQSAGELPPLPASFAVDPNEPEFIQLCRQRDHYGNEQKWSQKWDETQWRTYLYVYYRMVEHADACLGKILDALRRSGIEDDTLIVFTSDHGEGVAAHQWVVKLMLYEEPVTVPFILSWKGKLPSGRDDRTHLVSGLDVVPTLCDYAGIEPPSGMRGNSLKSVIENPALPGCEFVVSELAPDPKRMELKGRMLRTKQFKYVAFSHGRRPELLFDLDHDPGETNNLASRRECRDELHRHRALLTQWSEKTNDSFQTPR